MFDDYLDTPGNSGSSLLNQDQFHQLILDLSEEGLNLHVHSIGNKSTNTVLNAIEQAHETLSGRPPITISMCHLEVIRETDLDRFKDLGVIASFTPHWHGGLGGESTERAIGDLAHSMMRAQPMISDDAVVTFSSDIYNGYEWKDDSANPYMGMQVGHNRQDIEGGADARYSPPRSERLKLDALVDGYTRHGAFALGRSDELGSIEVGKRADFVVLNQNLFDVNRYDVHKTRPVAVIMDGEIVEGDL
jgi:predicted amidohydrolase YtcJ